MLKSDKPYKDLGDDYFDRLNPARTTRKLVARLGVRPRINLGTSFWPGAMKQSEPIMFHGEKLPAILPG
jgi:hypothetical protein